MSYYELNKERILRNRRIKRNNLNYDEREKIKEYHKKYYSKNKIKFEKKIKFLNNIKINRKTIIINFCN